MPTATGVLLDPAEFDPAGFDPAGPGAADGARRPSPPRADGTPHLWLLRATQHRAFALASAPDVLVAEERTRAAALRVPADRECYLATHVALRLLLGAYLDLSPREVPLMRIPCPCCGGPHGRPSVAGHPLHYSISHSGSLGLLAFAATPVGVDTETVPPARAVREASDALHPQELAELALLPEPARPTAFSRAWVRKEAYLKGLGIGLADDPAARYVGTGIEPAVPGPGWRLADVAVVRGFSAAVAWQH
ncbi:4'-phosphopantetheinyl transferase superfamily protein [Streptomyces sp. NPDC089919]|uniref:4'-phosphopantetheinyl transferase family protein n=1 Tax=Streptomyces sp. NPDC089919 TaxID=3155188 RepID=UPI003447793B